MGLGDGAEVKVEVRGGGCYRWVWEMGLKVEVRGECVTDGAEGRR